MRYQHDISRRQPEMYFIYLSGDQQANKRKTVWIGFLGVRLVYHGRSIAHVNLTDKTVSTYNRSLSKVTESLQDRCFIPNQVVDNDHMIVPVKIVITIIELQSIGQCSSEIGFCSRINHQWSVKFRLISRKMIRLSNLAFLVEISYRWFTGKVKLLTTKGHTVRWYLHYHYLWHINRGPKLLYSLQTVERRMGNTLVLYWNVRD